MNEREAAAGPALPRNFQRACVLLLLSEERAHGYDLLRRLEPLRCNRDDPGGLYRMLRAMEGDGLVSSAWVGSRHGPDRRIYELTPAGMEELDRWARALAQGSDALSLFLRRHAERAGPAGDATEPTRR